MQIIVYIFDNSTVRTSNYGLFSDLYWLNNQAKKKKKKKLFAVSEVPYYAV